MNILKSMREDLLYKKTISEAKEEAIEHALKDVTIGKEEREILEILLSITFFRGGIHAMRYVMKYLLIFNIIMLIIFLTSLTISIINF